MRSVTKLLTLVAVASLVFIASCGTEESVIIPDTTPPLAPVGVDLEEQSGGVRVSWAANAEPDLAGYNLYSSGKETGPYRIVNDELLLCPWCYDSPVTSEMTFYKATAVDESGNESAYSDVIGVYYNTAGGRDKPSDVR